MRLSLIDDDYDAEYWASQIRLATWIAIGVTPLAVLRVLSAWPPGDRWLIALLTLVFAVHCAALFLPWGRIVADRRVRQRLVLWWVAGLPLLCVFAALDSAGLVFYAPGAMLIITLASGLFPARTVVALGVLAMTGFAVLVPSQTRVSPTMAVGLGAILAVVAGLCAATARNRAWQEGRRRSVERRTEALLENASDAVLAIDGVTGDVSYASPPSRMVFGRDPQSLTGDRLAGMVHPDDLPKASEWMANLRRAPLGTVARIDSRIRRADGTWLYADVIGTSRVDDPDLRAVVLSVRDVGERRALEEQLTRQAFADALTGLPNRALFRDRVDHALARNRRGAGRVTLLLLDLDDFKIVNDSLGHTAGDQLLCALGVRLRNEVRGCDTLARIGGDEFAVLVEDVNDLEAAGLAERILTTVRRPVRLGNRDVVVTMSIGIATIKADQGQADADELLRDADLAMYAAKNGGRDRYAVFDAAMYSEVLREAQQRADMERALADDEFVVHYQPIVDLPQRRLTGFEALVRWQHPHDGLVGPNTFIPAAEATGLIVPLGRWVLRQACAQLAAWRTAWPEAAALRMSVNLSARQFQYDGLVADVAQALADSGLAADDLVLEITESMLMRDTDATVAILRDLKKLGVRLAIDDFGTGYSSLSYLKQFPVDIIKIDRSFVDDVGVIGGDSSSTTLAEAVVQLGRALQLQTVAEGIETADQWSALRTLGCEYGQGFLFARPVHPVDLDGILSRSGEALEADGPPPGAADPVVAVDGPPPGAADPVVAADGPPPKAADRGADG